MRIPEKIIVGLLGLIAMFTLLLLIIMMLKYGFLKIEAHTDEWQNLNDRINSLNAEIHGLSDPTPRY